MKKGLVILVVAIMLSLTVNPVFAQSQMTLADVDNMEQFQIVEKFEPLSFDATAKTLDVVWGDQKITLTDDGQTMAYIAQDLKNQSWLEVPLFSQQFIDYAGGKEYEAMIDITQFDGYNKGGVYSLVLVPEEIMPNLIVNYDQVLGWNNTETNLMVWKYPVDRYLIVENEKTGETAFVRSMLQYHSDFGIRITPNAGDSASGVVNVEKNPMYGFSILITKTKIVAWKANFAYDIWMFFHPDSIAVYGPSDACWNDMMWGNFVEQGIGKMLCGEYGPTLR